MYTVFALGSRALEGDSIALDACLLLAGKINGVDFVECASLDEVIALAGQKNERRLVVVDAVVGLTQPRMFEGLDCFENNRPSSAHDFDAGFFLKIAKESGLIDEVIVIGLPRAMKKEEAALAVRTMLEEFFSIGSQPVGKL